MVAEKNKYLLDFTHPPVEREVLHFMLDTPFWLSQQQTEEGDIPTILGGEVQLELTITPLPNRIFDLHLHYNGAVQVPCDRCLDPLHLSIEFEEAMKVILGAELNEENDEELVLPEQEPTYNFAFIFYELLLVQLPLQMVHPIEECNPQMLAYLVDELPEEEENEQDRNEINPQLAQLREKLAQNEAENRK